MTTTVASAIYDAHRAGAWVVVAGNGFGGFWSLAAHRWPRLRVKAFWPYIATIEVLIFMQVGLGVAYQNSSGIKPTGLHTLYGFSALFAVGILYSYRNQLRHKQFLLYGWGGLFLMGVGIRAMLLHA